MESVITPDDVTAAAARLSGVAHRTPVLTSRTLDAQTGASIHVKAECFQRGGSFKLRGAYNKISSLPTGQGVVAYSSGNHAQAVAIAARERGVGAVIVMPRDAPDAKLDATRGYGAEVVLYDRRTESREQIGRRLADERGLALVRPYDDPLVMAGQGTVALELLEEVPDLDVLVVPVGGGGLISGCATVAAAMRPGIRVVGVEPDAWDDTRRSLARGERVTTAGPDSIADGLLAPSPGELTFPVIRRLVADVVTVTDAQIMRAVRFLGDRMKVVAEPSGAAATAALLAGAVPAEGARVGVVLSGGNVGLDRLASLLDATR
jgi:threo-3-hydroxy-L-aspartate ammonia-lyase